MVFPYPMLDNEDKYTYMNGIPLIQQRKLPSSVPGQSKLKSSMSQEHTDMGNTHDDSDMDDEASCWFCFCAHLLPLYRCCILFGCFSSSTLCSHHFPSSPLCSHCASSSPCYSCCDSSSPLYCSRSCLLHQGSRPPSLIRQDKQ